MQTMLMAKISEEKYRYFRSKYEDKLNTLDARDATNRIRSMQGKPSGKEKLTLNLLNLIRRKRGARFSSKIYYQSKKKEIKILTKRKTSYG